MTRKQITTTEISRRLNEITVEGAKITAFADTWLAEVMPGCERAFRENDKTYKIPDIWDAARNAGIERTESNERFFDHKIQMAIYKMVFSKE